MAREIVNQPQSEDVFSQPVSASRKRKASALERDVAHTSSSAAKPLRASKGPCRLLWRGSLVYDDVTLHGLAFVAHLPSTSPVQPLSVKSANARPGLFRSLSSSSTAPLAPTMDDPFSPFSAPSGGNNATDLCLDIEMMRHQDLHVSRSATCHAPAPQPEPPPAKFKKGNKKRSSNQIVVPRRPPPDEITIERDADVRVYVDPRCSETLQWLENRFCCEEAHKGDSRSSTGLLIPLGDDANATELFLFGELETWDVDAELPSMQLLIGRRRVVKVAGPRPDDPLPRETVFVQQLRRTASQPVLSAATITEAARAAARPRNPFARTTSTSAIPPAPRIPSLGVPGSPTPSVASSTGSLKPSKPGKMARSQSMPAGVFAAKLAASNKAESASIDYEGTNKATIRKVVVACLKERGIGRDAEEFKELFGQVCKGVQFAMRTRMHVAAVDRQEAKRFTLLHLDMYLPPSDPGGSVVHPQEDDEMQE